MSVSSWHKARMKARRRHRAMLELEWLLVEYPMSRVRRWCALRTLLLLEWIFGDRGGRL